MNTNTPKNVLSSFLIESEIEKAEIVLSVKAITDELQRMAEKISKMQIEDVSAITERLKAEFGVSDGDSFQQEVSALLQTSLDALRATKASVDNKALVLSGDNTDVTMDHSAAPVDQGQMPAVADDVDDMFAGHEAAAGPEEEPLGRVKKESFLSAKRSLVEGATLLKKMAAGKEKSIERIEKLMKDATPAEKKTHKAKIDSIKDSLKADKKKLKQLAESARFLKESDSESYKGVPVEDRPRSSRGPDLSVRPVKINHSFNNMLDQMSQAFSPEMETLSAAALRLTKQAELVGAKRLQKTPEEVADLGRQIDGMTSEVKGKLHDVKASETGKTVAYTGILRMLHAATNFLEKAKHADINTQVNSMIDRLEKNDLTESAVYKKAKKLQEASIAQKVQIINEAATRKDFQLVADTLKEIPDEEKRKELAKHHVEIFKKQNPRFSHSKFYAAAGVKHDDSVNESEKKVGYKITLSYDNHNTGKLKTTNMTLSPKSKGATSKKGAADYALKTYEKDGFKNLKIVKVEELPWESMKESLSPQKPNIEVEYEYNLGDGKPFKTHSITFLDNHPTVKNKETAKAETKRKAEKQGRKNIKIKKVTILQTSKATDEKKK